MDRVTLSGGDLRSLSLAAIGGAACAIAFDALYIWVFEREDGANAVLVAGSIAAAAALLVASLAIRASAARAGVLAAATGLLAAWAVIASLSVGVLLLPAAALALSALMDAIHELPRGSAWLPLIFGIGSALVVVGAGLQLGG